MVSVNSRVRNILYINKIKYYKKTGIFFLFLIVSLIKSCLTVHDPGWPYSLIHPELPQNEKTRYIYNSDSLNIRLSAADFAFGTYVSLRIKTPLDSIIIYPNFSYIESPHFINKVHIPDNIETKHFSKGSLIDGTSYIISEIKGKWPLGISITAWEKDSIIIYEETKRKRINKEEFLKPYCLHKGDSLIVLIRHRSFAIYDERNRKRDPFNPSKFYPEKSDFIFYYDVYNNNKPLTFYFKPTTGKVDEE